MLGTCMERRRLSYTLNSLQKVLKLRGCNGDYLCGCEVRPLQGVQGLDSGNIHEKIQDTRPMLNVSGYLWQIAGVCYMRELFMLHIN